MQNWKRKGKRPLKGMKKIKAELEAKEKKEKAKQKRIEPILEAIIAYGAAHER